MPVAKESCAETSLAGLTLGSRLRALAWPIACLGAIAALSGDLGSYEHSLKVVAQVIGYFWRVSPDQVGASGWLEDALLYIRKPAHVLLYALLAWSLYNCLRTLTDWPRKRVWVAALILCTVCALVDEMHQATVPSRTGLPSDVMLDVLAGATVLLLQKARENRLPLLAEDA
jgi:hypothetical protein